MAEYFVDPSAPVDGAGTEISPFNTFAGRTWGSNNVWRIKCGATIKSTITITSASNILVMPYSTGALPLLDCENVRSVALDTNAQPGITVEGLRFINQIGTANGALRLSGSTAGTRRGARNCEFQNCQISILLNNAVNCHVHNNIIDAGNTGGLNIAYGIRLNGALTTLARIEDNTIVSSAGLTYGTGIEVFTSANNEIRRNVIRAPSCDGILLRNGATGNYIRANIIAGDMKDLLALENASSNYIYNNTLMQSGFLGDTFPCLKLGNDFGAGSPSDLNDIRNNIMVSGSSIPYVNQNGGQNNTSNNNVIINAGQFHTLAVRYDYFGGTPNSFLTLDQWQALGNGLNGSSADPQLSADYRPMPGSPCLKGGADLGYMRDLDGKQCKKHIGAYGYARVL